MADDLLRPRLHLVLPHQLPDYSPEALTEATSPEPRKGAAPYEAIPTPVISAAELEVAARLRPFVDRAQATVTEITPRTVAGGRPGQPARRLIAQLLGRTLLYLRGSAEPQDQQLCAAIHNYLNGDLV